MAVIFGLQTEAGHRSFNCLESSLKYRILAEAVRFELTDPFEPPVFKTGAIDHSATLPAGRIVTSFYAHFGAEFEGRGKLMLI